MKWSAKPEQQDYAAAKSYLSLLFDEQTASNYCEALKQASTVEFEAKDLFRASELPLLGTNNSHVKKDQKRIVTEKKLSALLLVEAGAEESSLLLMVIIGSARCMHLMKMHQFRAG
ncbi:MAG: hypothetical protein WA269_07100 [Candidatus Udaeobacter sp.]